MDGTPPPRKHATKACDQCRLRRIKCKSTSKDNDDGKLTPCDACQLGSLGCTFELPVKRRGPAPKQRFVSRASHSAPSPPEEHRSTPASEHVVGALPSPGFFQAPRTPLKLAHFFSVQTRDNILRDYLEQLNPIIPLVHGPSFLEDLQAHREDHDAAFLAFVLSLCGLVVASIPRKIHEYRGRDPSLRFQDRQEFVEGIQDGTNWIRRGFYWHELSLIKWSTSYALGLTTIQLGGLMETKLMFAQCHATMKELGFHRISTYKDLNPIETQLRKKAFCLYLMSYAHLRLQSLTWDTLSDRFDSDRADIDLLKPLEVDDEYITEDGVLEPPPNTLSLVVALNVHSRLNACLTTVADELNTTLVFSADDNESHRHVIGHCHCGHSVRPIPLISVVKRRLDLLNSVLRDFPEELRLSRPGIKAAKENISDPQALLRVTQHESWRANIHVSALWAQGALVETLVSLSSGEETFEEIQFGDLWEFRVNNCRQLWQLLTEMTPADLEPNGRILHWKTREIAAALLEYLAGDDLERAAEATRWIKRFTEILGSLDAQSRNHQTLQVPPQNSSWTTA